MEKKTTTKCSLPLQLLNKINLIAFIFKTEIAFLFILNLLFKQAALGRDMERVLHELSIFQNHTTKPRPQATTRHLPAQARTKNKQIPAFTKRATKMLQPTR